VRAFRQDEPVVIHCENCEPEAARVVSVGPRCPECGNRTYRVQTEAMLVECCSSILRPVN
jgi:Zn finger protein HypA/HybF involved in hydrogenase expression